MEVIIKEVGNRLDKALADFGQNCHVVRPMKRLRLERSWLNGKSAKAKYAVKEGDVIT